MAANDKPDNLFAAIESGNVQIVRELITAGEDVNSAISVPSFISKMIQDQLIMPFSSEGGFPLFHVDHWFGITPLMCAAFKQEEEIISILLEHGANIHAEDSIGVNLLGYAILGCSEKIALLLLARGSSANSATHTAVLKSEDKIVGNSLTIKGLTPLHLAAKAGFVEVINALLKNGADPEATDESGKNPLQMAADNCRPEAVSAIWQTTRSLQRPRQAGEAIALLDFYLQSGINCHEILQPLIESTLHDDYPYAVFAGRYSSTEDSDMTLWKYGCKKNKGVALRFLVENNYYSITDYPLADRPHNSPLQIACRYHLLALASFILTNNYYSPVPNDLEYAFVSLPLLEECLKAGLSKPYTQNGVYQNPLMGFLVKYNFQELEIEKFALLFAYGAIYENQYCGECVLVSLAARNQYKIFPLLVRHGANLNETDKNGFTALMKAAAMGSKETLFFLVSAGVKLNLQNEKGQTALWLAINYNKSELAKHLILSGAKPDLIDISGTTPRKLAEKRKLAEIISLLK